MSIAGILSSSLFSSIRRAFTAACSNFVRIFRTAIPSPRNFSSSATTYSPVISPRRNRTTRTFSGISKIRRRSDCTIITTIPGARTAMRFRNCFRRSGRISNPETWLRRNRPTPHCKKACSSTRCRMARSTEWRAAASAKRRNSRLSQQRRGRISVRSRSLVGRSLAAVTLDHPSIV